jgi:ABC-type multidrug transport system ATPase subunit
MSAVLELRRVHARDSAGRRGIALGRLYGLDRNFAAGIHAVLGTVFDGTAALAEVCSGRRAPRSGQVLVRQRKPYRSAVARRHIASLGVHPELGPVDRVRDAVALASAAHGVALDDSLERWGLAPLADRRLISLSRGEGRAVELALAMSQPEPWLVVLYEPFVDVALVDQGRLRAELMTAAQAGSCVVLLSSHVGELDDLADHVHLLERGRWLGGDDEAGWQAHSHELVAWLDDADACRALARALSTRAELSGVAWTAPAQSGALGCVTVRSGDIAAASLAVAEEVARLELDVTSLHAPPQSLERVRQQARLRAAERRRSEAAAAEQPAATEATP